MACPEYSHHPQVKRLQAGRRDLHCLGRTHYRRWPCRNDRALALRQGAWLFESIALHPWIHTAHRPGNLRPEAISRGCPYGRSEGPVQGLPVEKEAARSGTITLDKTNA